uniref:Beta-alanine--pyruvate transaminase n=3 Tax=Phaeomonas parva TaxID=124430 RepID=A0A6U4LHM6_9STRA|mmetsp:Transcript_8224/g.23411  ORF Transcript_8224/g.23411 Transcript_8224/m.23411 type:complete len:341 (+) Transcript_8224:569-1591(+)
MCGSTSVDTALKMALAYHRSRGEGSRTIFIGREKAYHGTNISGASVGGIGGNRAQFTSALIPTVDHLKSTLNIKEQAFTVGEPEEGADLADELLDLIALHGPANIAAVIMEPVAGSAGVFVPPKGYLKRLRQICDDHGILLILDEVITAFGRLGTPFAMDYFGISADIVTTAKGLTSAVVPAGAVIAQQHVYDAIVGGAAPETIELFHGYTYSCHPVAAAAGIATLEHYHEAGLYENAAAMVPVLEDALHSNFDASNPYVVDVRNIGLMGAIQLRTPPGMGPGKFGHAVMNHLWFEEDVYVRFTGDTLAFSPAFIVQKEQIYAMMEAVKRGVDAVGPRFF